jgi:hypothetical protein
VRPAQDQIEPVEPIGVHGSPLTRNRARLATPVPSGKARGVAGTVDHRHLRRINVRKPTVAPDADRFL